MEESAALEPVIIDFEHMSMSPFVNQEQGISRLISKPGYLYAESNQDQGLWISSKVLNLLQQHGEDFFLKHSVKCQHHWTRRQHSARLPDFVNHKQHIIYITSKNLHRMIANCDIPINEFMKSSGLTSQD